MIMRQHCLFLIGLILTCIEGTNDPYIIAPVNRIDPVAYVELFIEVHSF
jgi:hypothetical protein